MAGKQLVAKSKVEYRGITIMDTENGFSMILNGNRFDCESLSEATALIDAAAVLATRKVLQAGAEYTAPANG